MNSWKNPILLLFSIGISSIGDFIYLVAINIIVYQLTGSAAAVAGLWIIAPLVNIITKFWTGSFIDYRSKRKVMIVTYIIRAVFICFIPLAPNMIVIYAILVVLSIANAFFHPSSTTYVTILVPKEKRKRFNSFRSFASSGAFIIGPAIGGSLILLTSVEITLWINAVFFLIAVSLLFVLPEKENINKDAIPALTISQVIQDFTVVQKIIANNKYVSFIYLGFIMIMLFTFAMDTQEVVFTQQVIGLSEFEYSMLISITGIGSVAGAILLSIFANKISLRYMIVFGLIMMTVGYVIYAFSWSFASIVVGFIILGFFMVFLNAGIMTFYQNNIPVEVMGRVTSIYQLIQSANQVLFILIIGVTADIISLRLTIATLAMIMLFSSFIYSIAVLKQDKKSYYQENDI
ncbi:MFS transporter [Virgibacillus pantothenticus]|uniref:MFS transporter n=1 Tax=Virgibacillus pantothenticus TaxID=1473 RepID=UPI001B204B7E|nr:MFS transporter [Virgibacillus pantothenticus]MBU8566698.1 MFS transporter [Virgibacillus pantothenticus]MBU8600281.1 MFS transporter [Virgibacillus pantothenticus]MBU8634854.1 MFS transporter [Virgibacillus pantothenticus]MBU8642418.1 MFS transporter [Virgibacillus pantothenticus]MBU8646566.1 MFS transporter [Virgibacillus pantothenticus]